MKPNIIYARTQTVIRSSGHSVKEIVQFFNKTERWANKWSKRVCSEDKRRCGRLSILNNYAQNSIQKQSTNGIIQHKIFINFKQKSVKVSSITVWRYMIRKRWKAFKQKKNTFVERKVKESPVEIPEEKGEADLYFSCPIQH